MGSITRLRMWTKSWYVIVVLATTLRLVALQSPIFGCCHPCSFMVHRFGRSPQTMMRANSGGVESHNCAVTMQELVDLAARVRQIRPPGTWQIDDASEYRFPSSYKRGDGSLRGFCNWLAKQSGLMVGRYPFTDPTPGGPTLEEGRMHLRRILDEAGVTTFVCLQMEIPSQSDSALWPRGGIPLNDPFLRDRFPGAFGCYAHEATMLAPNSPLNFISCGIEDLGLPDDSQLLGLLKKLLLCLSHGETLYVHCWGGRGRAGLIGGCLLSLLQPQLSPTEVLKVVQAGYDSRQGSEIGELSRSPQTWEQRDFLHKFVKKVRVNSD